MIWCRRGGQEALDLLAARVTRSVTRNRTTLNDGRRDQAPVPQFDRFAESAPISTSAILFTPLFAVTMLP